MSLVWSSSCVRLLWRDTDTDTAPTPGPCYGGVDQCLGGATSVTYFQISKSHLPSCLLLGYTPAASPAWLTRVMRSLGFHFRIRVYLSLSLSHARPPPFPTPTLPTVRLLGIMLRNRCWLTAFHTTTAGGVNGWCQKWSVWSAPRPPNIQTWPPLGLLSIRLKWLGLD